MIRAYAFLAIRLMQDMQCSYVQRQTLAFTSPAPFLWLLSPPLLLF